MNQEETKQNPKGLSVNVNFDTTPIFYTDNIMMTTNPDGVVLDVIQRLATTDQARMVARIGMSREHAKKFVSELGKLILTTEGQAQTSDKKIN